jgi:hypothetical protein
MQDTAGPALDRDVLRAEGNLADKPASLRHGSLRIPDATEERT